MATNNLVALVIYLSFCGQRAVRKRSSRSGVGELRKLVAATDGTAFTGP